MVTPRTAPFTAEEEAAIAQIRSEWLAGGLCTDRIDRLALFQTWSAVYRLFGYELSEDAILVVPGPAAGRWAMAALQKTGATIASVLAEFGSRPWLSQSGPHRKTLFTWMGICEGYWLGWYQAGAAVGTIYTPNDTKRMAALAAIAKVGGPAWAFQHVLIVSERPTDIHVEWITSTGYRLHCPSGPAIRWADGHEAWFWHGLRIPAWYLRERERLTASVINDEQNTELRRAMIEILGWDRYMEMTGATTIATDRFGTLLRLQTGRDGEVTLVSVLNSTPEHDGRRKRYVLPVSDAAQTPQAALAETFRLSPDAYSPEIET